MIVGIPKETLSSETRVALIPGDLPRLTKRGIEIIIEAGAGVKAGYPDIDYLDKGATIAPSRGDLFKNADIIARVIGSSGDDDLAPLRANQVLLGFLNPLVDTTLCGDLERLGVTALAMELVPRITRAQSMDALSSMASLAGYRAVVLAAAELPKMFPMMMTAAGTLSPAKVFVLGAGVAGLQAAATANRLGAVVTAYDVRPEVEEQVKSVGAKFLKLELDRSDAGGEGGYAKEKSQEFYDKQREMMGAAIAASDVVITTAAIPGRAAPRLVNDAMVEAMTDGSVIVDLAAESGGNCELTQAGETVVRHGVTIMGPRNVPGQLPYHASQMYSRNVVNLILHLTTNEGELNIDLDDQITAATTVCHRSQLVSERVRSIMQPSKAS